MQKPQGLIKSTVLVLSVLGHGSSLQAARSTPATPAFFVCCCIPKIIKNSCFIQVNSICTAPFLSKEYCCYLYCSTTNNAHHHGVLLTDTVDSCFTGADDSERSGKCVGRHVRPLVDKALLDPEIQTRYCTGLATGSGQW